MCDVFLGIFVRVVCRSVDSCDCDGDFTFKFKVRLNDSSKVMCCFESVFADCGFFEYDAYTRTLWVFTVMGPAGYVFFVFLIEIEICFDRIEFCFC